MCSTLRLFILCTKINGQVFNVEYVMTVVTHSHPKDHIAYAEFNSLFGQGKTINKRHNIYILMHTHSENGNVRQMSKAEKMNITVDTQLPQ